MLNQRKLTKALGVVLISAMGMGIFLPAVAKEKTVVIKMDVPENCEECTYYAMQGLIVGALDGAVRTFTSAYLNNVLFNKLLGKSLGAVGAGLITHGCFELAQRAIMTPKTTVYNAPYYTGLITTTLGLTPKLARHEKTIKKIGDSFKETFGTIAKGAFSFFSGGIAKIQNLIDKSDAKAAKEISKTVVHVIQEKAAS